MHLYLNSSYSPGFDTSLASKLMKSFINSFFTEIIIFLFRSVPDLYAEKLNEENVLSVEEAKKMQSDYMDYLNEEHKLAAKYQPEPSYFQKQWQHITTASDNITYWDTGLDYGLLNYIGQQSVKYPEGFVSTKKKEKMWKRGHK